MGVSRDDAHTATLTVMRCRSPKVFGEAPTSRFRHTTVFVSVDPDSALAERLGAALPPRFALEDGHVLVIFGGYNTTGKEFGGKDIEVRRLGPPAHKVVCFQAISRPSLLKLCDRLSTEIFACW